MNQLDSRKRLLIAESELNRAKLVQKWQTMTDEAHALANQAKTVGVVAAVATLVAGLVVFRHKRSTPVPGKSSWWQTLLKGSGVFASFWQILRGADK